MVKTIDDSLTDTLVVSMSDPPAERIYRAMREQHLREMAARGGVAVALHGDHRDEFPPFPTTPSTRQRVVAYVNHGRWVWDCPTPRCGGAQVTSPKDPRAFCVECFNAGDGWWPVDWPDERTTIERILNKRPAATQQNWWPTETMQQLEAENIQLGIGDT